jgi:hypothetical protein
VEHNPHTRRLKLAWSERRLDRQRKEQAVATARRDQQQHDADQKRQQQQQEQEASKKRRRSGFDSLKSRRELRQEEELREGEEDEQELEDDERAAADGSHCDGGTADPQDYLMSVRSSQSVAMARGKQLGHPRNNASPPSAAASSSSFIPVDPAVEMGDNTGTSGSSNSTSSPDTAYYLRQGQAVSEGGAVGSGRGGCLFGTDWEEMERRAMAKAQVGTVFRELLNKILKLGYLVTHKQKMRPAGLP